MKRILLYALVAFPALLLSSCNKEMEENVNGLTEKQSEMAATLESLKGTDAELDALIDAVEARIVTLEGKVADLESGVGDLETSVGDLESGVGDLETSVGDLETSIGAMQSEIATLKTSLETLQAMNKKIDATIKELEESIRTSEGQMYEFNNRLAEIEKFTSELEALKGQLEELGVIRTDVESLKQSLQELLAADADLNQLLVALTSRADDIETEIEALKNAGSGDSSGGTDIPSGGSDTPSDNSQVEALETRVAELESELEELNQTITVLSGSLNETRNTITDIAKTMLNYANKTDLTALETELMAQINTVKSDVTALTNECAEKFGVIETDIETIQQSLVSLEEADKGVAGLISALEERATEIEADIEILENSVTGSIETVNSKIAELSEELTAVKTAIQNLQAKDSQIDAAIASLNVSIEASQQANENAMAAIEADLAEQLAQIEGLSESLQQHIQTATTTFATQEALSGLSAEIAQLKTDYEARFDLIESEIGGIVAMIQSMTPISKWSNGDASARYYTDWANEKNNLATVEFNYIVRPSGAAARLAQAWAENKDLMQFRAHYTITRASFDFVDMDVMDVSASDDILTVTGYVDGISEAWINDQESFSVSLLVTDGKTDYCTPFVNIRGDLQGTDLSADETANCYMVHEPGYYRFRAGMSVIKNDGSQSTPSIAPYSAEVMWESLGTTEIPEVGCLIEPELEIRNNYVYFKTNDTWKDGNALIAVRNADGDITWSCHLWMIGDYPQHRTYANDAGTIMGVNLGALDGHSSGLLYQWGRKDPFLGTVVEQSGNTQVKSTIEWPAAVTSDETTGTKNYALSHPTTFILANEVNNHWLYQSSPDLSKLRIGTWFTDGYTSKSLNDPCPPGWRIPEGNYTTETSGGTTFEYSIWSIARNKQGDFNASIPVSDIGLTCYNYFGGTAMGENDYYFSGYLSEEYGILLGNREVGYYWTETDYDTTSGYNCLKVDNNGNVKFVKEVINGARGASVRCVKRN